MGSHVGNVSVKLAPVRPEPAEFALAALVSDGAFGKANLIGDFWQRHGHAPIVLCQKHDSPKLHQHTPFCRISDSKLKLGRLAIQPATVRPISVAVCSAAQRLPSIDAAC
jgi:hypothetical protein